MSKNKLKQSKKCGLCKKELPIDAFKLKKNGKYNIECLDCRKRKENIRVASGASLVTSKKCQRCGEVKLVSKFGNSTVDNRLLKICKDCLWYNDPKVKKRRAKQALMDSRPTTPFIPEIDINKPLDLSFLNDLGGFSEQEIKRLLLTVEVYTKDPHFLSSVAVFAKFFPHRKVKLCKQILEEFIEVYRAGIEFDAYIKQGRKFRKDGLKQLAGKK